ncbi:hypothetical protein EVAR_14046_1 [Eumeta japonica]|uniref:Uncharacterized protein n=1 Tax=Eumeta variegata TaxID=151549 RepID=A0A4C1UN39_EUMVA|nr:hypothetical protein EVAR_14046_1 [Eumeta japonica]
MNPLAKQTEAAHAKKTGGQSSTGTVLVKPLQPGGDRNLLAAFQTFGTPPTQNNIYFFFAENLSRKMARHTHRLTVRL